MRERGGKLTLTTQVAKAVVAVLGLARARLQQVTEGSLGEATVTTRLMLPLCLAFDHRVCDGGEAGRFVTYVAQLCEQPARILLHA